MDTKKFKTDPSGTGNSTAKGGRNNTKIILTAAGSVAAGMAAGAAASQIFSGTSPEPNPSSEPQKEDIAQKEEMGKEEVAGQSVNETTQATDGKLNQQERIFLNLSLQQETISLLQVIAILQSLPLEILTLLLMGRLHRKSQRQ